MSYIKNLVTFAWHLIYPSSTSSSQCLTSSQRRQPNTSETKETFDLLSHKCMSRRSRVENWNIELDSASLEYLLHNTPLPTKTTSAGQKRKRTHLLTPDSNDYKRKHRKNKKRRMAADIEMMDVDMEEAGYSFVNGVLSLDSDEDDDVEQEEEYGVENDDGEEEEEVEEEEEEGADDESVEDNESDEGFESKFSNTRTNEEVSDQQAGDEDLEDVEGSENSEEMVSDEEEVLDGEDDEEAGEEEVEEDEEEEQIDNEEYEAVEGSDYDLLEVEEADDNNTTYESAEEDISSLVAEMEDANLDTIVHRTREVYSPGKLKARDTERIDRLAEVADLAHAGWTGHDLTLYRVLHLRGLEPLMPRDWAGAIQALPYELFTDIGKEEEAFIRDRRGHSGSMAMLKLLTIGGYIRQLFEYGNLERRFRQMIKEFENWALVDIKGMKLRRWRDKKVLTLAVITAPKFADNDTLMRKAIRKLERMEAKWKVILEGTGRDVSTLR